MCDVSLINIHDNSSLLHFEFIYYSITPIYVKIKTIVSFSVILVEDTNLANCRAFYSKILTANSKRAIISLQWRRRSFDPWKIKNTVLLMGDYWSFLWYSFETNDFLAPLKFLRQGTRFPEPLRYTLFHLFYLVLLYSYNFIVKPLSWIVVSCDMKPLYIFRVYWEPFVVGLKF